ncbi:hypothetical protein X975_21962, partial [Stegodyphus mimosarum]
MILAFGDSSLLNPNIVALFGVISASNSAFNPYIYLMFQSKETWFGRCFRLLRNNCQCPKSSNRPGNTTSFVSASSKTSSRNEINIHSLLPQAQAIKISSGNISKKSEETYL